MQSGRAARRPARRRSGASTWSLPSLRGAAARTSRRTSRRVSIAALAPRARARSASAAERPWPAAGAAEDGTDASTRVDTRGRIGGAATAAETVIGTLASAGIASTGADGASPELAAASISSCVATTVRSSSRRSRGVPRGARARSSPASRCVSMRWLSLVRRVKRMPMPGSLSARVGSASRVQNTVPSPASSVEPSASCKFRRTVQPTASTCALRTKMPPRLTSLACLSRKSDTVRHDMRMRRSAGPVRTADDACGALPSRRA